MSMKSISAARPREAMVHITKVTSDMNAGNGVRTPGFRRRQARVDLHPRVLQRLEQTGGHAAEQGDEGDDKVGGGESPLLARHGLASTMILPAMVWWAMPQYSWQMIGYSPGVSKRAWAWE